MSKEKTTSQELCAYCGIKPSIEDEHVIPKALFKSTENPEYIVVPTCRDCNVEKSKHDGDLRDLIKIDKQIENHPAVNAGLDKVARSYVRSITENRGGLLKRAKIYEIPKISNDESEFDTDLVVVFDKQKELPPIFTWVVRGLYYSIKKARLPKNVSIKVKKIDGPEEKELLVNSFLNAPSLIGPKFFGQDIFAYLAFIDNVNPTRTRWLLFFYDQVCFVISTDPQHITNGYKRKSKE